jgi:hypothetical protein
MSMNLHESIHYMVIQAITCETALKTVKREREREREAYDEKFITHGTDLSQHLPGAQ